jgi:hypothetical protein
MYPQNFKMIGATIKNLEATNEKSKMAAGSHLGYQRSFQNNKFLPLGPLNIPTKFQDDQSKHSGPIGHE